METELQKKLQEVVDKTGMTLVEIARNTGISKENIYKWSHGTRPSDSYVFNKLIKFLDDILTSIPKMPLDELEATYAMMRETGSDYIGQKDFSYMVKVPIRHARKPVPLMHVKGAAGTVIYVNDEPELILNRIDAPFLGIVDGVTEVKGDSMEPTFPNGCRVAILRLQDKTILNWGGYYFVIDKNHAGTVKRVYQGPSENTILLVSDNEDKTKYPPIVRTWDQIEAIFMVMACFIKW